MEELKYFAIEDFCKSGANLITPSFSDFKEEFGDLVMAELRNIYRSNPKFIRAVPLSHLHEWKRTGLLNLLFSDLKGFDSAESVFEYDLRISEKDLKRAFVREAYVISPEYVGIDRDSALSDPAFKKIYMREYGKMMNNIVPFSEFKKEDCKYKNPEVLIPFSVAKPDFELSRRIDLHK